MAQDYPDHWLEDIVNKIRARKPIKIALATGKTPSGHIHMGILRELMICDSIRRIFEKEGKEVIFRLFIDSLDAAKRFPIYVNKKFAKENLGKPFSHIPSPFNDIEANSYAEYFGNELYNTFDELGIKVEIVWAHELYKTEEMKKRIRIGLEKSDLVKDTVLKFITASMDEEKKQLTLENYKNWMPAMVICEKCHSTQKKMNDGSISPNRVLSYNQKDDSVTYKCPACGYEGITKISDGFVKLNWRLDWPAKWDIFKTICEPAGKDHCTQGGSYDTGLELSKKIFGYEGPVKVGYEWLRLGDQDMSTSKGVVFTPKKYLSMVEPEIIRMLILKTDPNRHISFRIEDISLLYDEFERIERIYYGLENAENEQIKKEINYYYPLSKPGTVTKKCPPQIPFKFLLIMSQLQDLISLDEILQKAQKIQETKGIKTKITKKYLKKRLDKTSNWLQHLKELIEEEKDSKMRKGLLRKAEFFTIAEEITPEIKNKLNSNQKTALKMLSEFLNQIDELTEENLKEKMMKIQKDIDIKPKELFQAIYLVLIDATVGPRLGPFITLLDLNWLRKRFSSI